MYEKAIPEDANLFGSAATLEGCDIAIIPVTWEATTSYGQGTSLAPQAIRKASHQLDFFERSRGGAIDQQVFMLPIEEKWLKQSQSIQEKVQTFRKSGDSRLQEIINTDSSQLNAEVEARSLELLKLGKQIGLLGGDHSCPLGLIKALSTLFERFGILHIDAHHDLRNGYEGFSGSHASIMHAVLEQVHTVERLVSVAIRDFSQEEFERAHEDDRIVTFYDADLHQNLADGANWSSCCEAILEQLPSNVYISFDIDGLDPSLCPNTGTPVPGGLSYNQAIYLLECLGRSGKNVIGFDLCEVGVNPTTEWDANVGARVLYQLCSLLHAAHS